MVGNANTHDLTVLSFFLISWLFGIWGIFAGRKINQNIAEMKKLEQIVLLLTCFCVVAVAAIQRDGNILGHDLNAQSDTTQAEAPRVEPMKTLSDGTQVINTTDLGKDISGYGGAVPLEIYLKDGKIEKVEALKNSETPDFFKAASPLLSRWNGKTPDEALNMKVDAVSGATFSSRGIIGNMRAGLQYASKNAATTSFFDKMDLSAKSIIGLIVVLMGAILPLFLHSKRYHTLQLWLNVVVLGLWSGTFLSWSLFVNFMSSGINVWVSLIPIVMLITAFIYPLFGKKNYYCTNICPFGSAQDLAAKANKKHKLKLGQNAVKRLGYFRQLLFAVLMVLMLTGVFFDWMNYELFTAFIFQSASVVVIALAVLVVILAVFIPRPYCRFVCPTGTLFKLSQNQK